MNTKYRVWEVEAKYMSTVAGLDWTMAGIKWYGPGVGSGWCYLDPDFDWDSPNTGPKPKHVDILMQYTGLPDKKGVEIYEGDILEHQGNDNWQKGSKLIIEHGKMGLLLKTTKGWCYAFFANHPSDMIVIGNIHENNELLGE